MKNRADHPWEGQEYTAAQMLEKFLIPRSMQHMPVGRLSGGERRRVYLLKVLMEAPNVLFLDEPTNDLDLVTLDILEDYLDGFPGIVLTVSHDRYFMDRVCDSVFVFQEDGSLKQYMGGYTEARSRTKRKSGPKQTRGGQPSAAQADRADLHGEKRAGTASGNHGNTAE